MDPGTAAHRLRGDLLWGFVQATGGLCYRCGQPMARETFSIDHIEPWLDSVDPVERFFNPDNVGYSHMACNYSDARRVRSKFSLEERKARQREHNRAHAARKRAKKALSH